MIERTRLLITTTLWQEYGTLTAKREEGLRMVVQGRAGELDTRRWNWLHRARLVSSDGDPEGARLTPRGSALLSSLEPGC